MAYEMKDGEGSLFKNTKREKDSHPHLTGKIMIDGTLYWLSAWRKAGKNGKADWLSLSARKVDGSGRNSGSAADDDGDIPFGWLLAIGLASWSMLGAMPWT